MKITKEQKEVIDLNMQFYKELLQKATEDTLDNFEFKTFKDLFYEFLDSDKAFPLNHKDTLKILDDILKVIETSDK